MFPFRTAFDPQAMDDYIDRVIEKCGDEDDAVAEMMNRWLAGLAPHDVFRPSGEFARMVADYAHHPPQDGRRRTPSTST